MEKGQFERKVPELLVPASGMRELFAAVENGADAVYLGGKFFNARKNAKNFDNEELEEAVKFAHAYDVKVYVTTNILLYDEELIKALEYAKFLYEIGTDALIIQDLGFAAMIKKHIPDFEIHLSTQASIYNLDGVLQAKELGFSRVVLARENTLDDIKHIALQTDVEIEVFVHGAICICYSGQCQFSNNIGGRSGNRGECAQPCRMKFNSSGQNAHVLSPKDMSCIEYLKEISEAGVSSIKIEGRMKSAEYVAVVCKLYRKYLDKYKENGEYQVAVEDMRDLAQIFNRGNFTSAYFFGNQGESFMSKKLAKHQGIYIGNAICKVSETLVDVKLENDNVLNVGDGVEFANSELSGNVLSYVKNRGKGRFRIGDIRGNVKCGDPLYKISDKTQMLAASESVFRVERGKGLRKSKIDMKIEIKKNEFPILTASSAGKEIYVTGKTKAEHAYNLSLSSEVVEKQLAKLGTTPFELVNFSCILDDDVSLPISALNELRREAVFKLEAIKAGKRKLEKFYLNEIQLEKIKNSICKNEFEIYFHEVNEKSCKLCAELLMILEKNGKISKTKLIISVWDLLEKGKQVETFLSDFQNNAQIESEIALIPYIFPISTGKHDRYVRKNLSKILELAGNNGIYIGNLGALNLLKDKKIELFADYGMNIINGEAEKMIYQMGFSKVFYAHEMNKNAFGAIPLMISEHKFAEHEITDKKQKKYIIKFLNHLDKSLIYEKVENTVKLANANIENGFRMYI
ncbi:MAG: peptidase U32 family protein [Eubacteriales bacterium]